MMTMAMMKKHTLICDITDDTSIESLVHSSYVSYTQLLTIRMRITGAMKAHMKCVSYRNQHLH